MAEQSIWQAPGRGATPQPPRWASAAPPTTPFYAARSAMNWSWTPPLPVSDTPRTSFTRADFSAEPSSVGTADPRDWTYQGGGHVILKGIALAHVAIGLLGVVLGILAWYLLLPGELLPVVAGGTALLATLAGAIALELSRSMRSGIALAARVLLVGADLLIAACLLWLLGGDSLAPTLFLVPVVVAALFFSTRRALVVAALAIAGFVAICAAQSAFDLAGWLPTAAQPETWLPRAIALATIAVLLIYCCGLSVEYSADNFASMFLRTDSLAGQREALRGEQQRLIQTMRQLENTHAGLVRERAITHHQIIEITSAVARLADGDASAIQALSPGMHGPLNTLAGPLSQLAQQLTTRQRQQRQSDDVQRDLSALAGATREQSRLLALTDTTWRELSAAANELVAHVQRSERDDSEHDGSQQDEGELPGANERARDQSLRAIERHALTQASDTAMLGARLAQLRARQSQIETSLRHCARAVGLDDQDEPDAGEPAAAREGEHELTLSPHAPYCVSNPGMTPSFPRLTVGQRLEPFEASTSQRPDRLM